MVITEKVEFEEKSGDEPVTWIYRGRRAYGLEGPSVKTLSEGLTDIY